MLTFSRWFLVLPLTAAMAAGNTAVCAGWAPTPEARMACCHSEQPCSMHEGGSDAPTAAAPVTQADADSCCALSEQEQSGQLHQSVAVPVSGATLGDGIVVPPTLPRLVLTDPWRSIAPMPPPPVSRHVLLSVFLL